MPLLMLTTVEEHDLSMVLTGKIVRGVPLMKPQTVIDHNNAKKGIDFPIKCPVTIRY